VTTSSSAGWSDTVFNKAAEAPAADPGVPASPSKKDLDEAMAKRGIHRVSVDAGRIVAGSTRGPFVVAERGHETRATVHLPAAAAGTAIGLALTCEHCSGG